MSTDSLDELKEFCERIGLDLKAVRHIVLSNGWELFGEIQDYDLARSDSEDDMEVSIEIVEASDDQIIVSYPLRVIRDSEIRGGEYYTQSVFIPYNSYSSNTTAPINSFQVISIDDPDMEAKVEYAINLFEDFHKEDEERPSIPVIKKVCPDIEKQDNVVQFSDYRK